MNSGRERVERRLAAVLAADVAGYSQLMGADEEGAHAALTARRHDISDPKIAGHRGRAVKITSDGLLVEFASVVDAVRCAVELQREMALRNGGVAKERRIEFRIGINLGDVIIEDRDIYGDGVNLAARLEALSEPGGICVSRVVRDQVRDKVDFGFEDLGEQQVKNIARPVHVYRIPLAETARTKAPLPLPDKPSLAVLPFQNMTGDAEKDYFVDGIVEEITTAISRLAWLFVIARNSSFTYKGRAVDVKQVTRELGVRYVLEGSVRQAGNRVRITGQLIPRRHLRIADEVAGNVVGAIEPKLQQSEIERATRKPTESLDAYDLYLRALGQFHKYTQEGMREVIALLKLALAIDPFYAPAAAMIGWCRTFQRIQGWGPVSDAEVAEGVQLTRQAVAVGKDDPDTLWTAGMTLWFLADEQSAAGNVIDRAVALNRNSAHAWNASGWTSSFRNQPTQAIESLQQAMRLSPFDPLGWTFAGGLAFAHLFAHRFEEPIEWAERALHQQPRWTPAIRSRLVACAHLGHTEEARDWLRRLLDIQPGLTIAGGGLRSGRQRFRRRY
jgi:class 3 adenylate cyclase/tetratricopeptide (TPR) repeat protein